MVVANSDTGDCDPLRNFYTDTGGTPCSVAGARQIGRILSHPPGSRRTRTMVSPLPSACCWIKCESWVPAPAPALSISISFVQASSQQRYFFLPQLIFPLLHSSLPMSLIRAAGCTQACMENMPGLHVELKCSHWAFSQFQSLWKINVFLNPVRAFEIFSFWSCKSILNKNLSYSSSCFFMESFLAWLWSYLRGFWFANQLQNALPADWVLHLKAS